MAVAIEVTNEAACINLIEVAVSKFGAMHVLVNDAGLHHRGDDVSQT